MLISKHESHDDGSHEIHESHDLVERTRGLEGISRIDDPVAWQEVVDDVKSKISEIIAISNDNNVNINLHMAFQSQPWHDPDGEGIWVSFLDECRNRK